jgi:glycosyltransferase involved in cell wall biosynthesis
MTRGVRYYSYPDHSGYGLAALAYVRALQNAGVAGWGTPLLFRDGRHEPWRPADGVAALPIARDAETDGALQDLPALLEATGPKPYDTVILHTVPEHWPALVEKGKRNIGYTVWETDALPAHWLPLLNLPDKVLVPTAMNQALFVREGVAPPVAVVPHVRRHAWNAGSPADGRALRRELRVPDDHFLFYSIDVWDPRKALGELVTVFARAFGGDDKVTLVLKTSSAVHPLAADGELPGAIPERVRALNEAIALETGRAPAHIAVLAADGVAGRVIDALHATGDCYVSLSHGEGWGMGAFDAATLGKPVLIAPYGGPAEYLPADYPGFIDYTMGTVSGWRATASFGPPQRWALPDAEDAGRKLRRVVARHAEFLEPAAIASERIANRYAEPVVGRMLVAALDG